MTQLNILTWPVSGLGEAIEILARKARFISSPDEPPAPPDDLQSGDEEIIGEWITLAADRLGIEAEAVESSYSDLENMIRSSGPALIRLPGEETRFLAVLKGGMRKVSVITPDLSLRRIRTAMVREALAREMEGPLAEHIEHLLIEAGVPEERRMRARNAVLQEQLAGERIRGCWVLRLSPGAGFWALIRHARIPPCFLTIFGTHIISQIFMLLGWWFIGRGVFQGDFDRAWMLAWAMLIFTAIPFYLSGTYAGNLISVRTGGIFKKRLLYGILQLRPGEIRHQGAGQFMGRVMESESLESLALQGGLGAVVAVIEIFAAIWVLTMGAGGWSHASLLLMWMVLTAVMCWRYYLHTGNCIQVYREMTNDLVEQMVGHRTRLAQEDHLLWHEGEDRDLSKYLKLSERRDRAGMTLNAVITNGWMLIGLAGIAYQFVVMPESRAALAVSLGGVILASDALGSFMRGLQSIISVKIAYEQAQQIFQAAAQPRERPPVSFILPSEIGKEAGENDQPILMARDLSFRYRDQGRPVLKSCSLRIYEGDRVLLEGPSGGGKSTLASLLAGLRESDSGLLLLGGVDRRTIGTEAWRRRVVTAPQFHENHVLTETFSFNLLMGRGWPPRARDLEEAEIICRELGLGELLDRMPSGFQQMVGESGWRLSHGERSRLYIARALLQKSDIIILDESFAALDPENLGRALKCVLRRAPSLVVIAHP